MSQPKTLARRTFLQGVGVSMGLPLLEAMSQEAAIAAPAEGAAANGQPKKPVRMAFIFVPNGAIMPAWKPTEAGADYALSETLEGLAEHKGDFLTISGLAQDNGRAKGDGPGDHARCASTYLTGEHPYKTAGAEIHVGVSVDQAAAARVGDRTHLPSIELGLERGRTAGNCDSGYSCAYSSAVSWKSATTPMAKEIVPRAAYERLFGVGNASDQLRARRQLYRKSILDLVASQAKKLQSSVGRTDQRKLDEYFTSVRELELRIKRAERAPLEDPPEFDAPQGAPGDFEQHVRLMYDLLVLAFQTDTTRIATYMLGNAGSNRAYRMVDVSSGHHELSHHRNEEEKIADIKKIDRYLIDQFGYFLGRLKEVKEGEGTLLDNSMIVYGSGLSDANRHNHHDLPILLAGCGGGSIQTGRHLRFEQETPLNNLFLSLLDRMDAGIDAIGDSTGRLAGLTV